MSSSNQNLSSDQLNWSLGCDRFRGISALFNYKKKRTSYAKIPKGGKLQRATFQKFLICRGQFFTANYPVQG